VTRPYVRNFSKRFDVEQAAKLRETFTNKPAEKRTEFPWAWPTKVREIGVGLAVMYRSDKWKKKGDYEDYKHICESKTPWTLYATPKFELDRVEFLGPEERVPAGRMPGAIAILALFLGIQCRLYRRGARSGIYLPEGDEGLFEVKISQAKIAAGRTEAGDLFLMVYKDKKGDSGPLLFLFGEELDVEKDGIVG
jgi:hypothetical protein